jgi:hypothetical protein
MGEELAEEIASKKHVASLSFLQNVCELLLNYIAVNFMFTAISMSHSTLVT